MTNMRGFEKKGGRIKGKKPTDGGPTPKKASSKFIRGGRSIFGPDARSLLVTLLLIIVPATVFWVFVAWHLPHEFSSSNAGYAILVMTILFTIWVLVILLLTSSRDADIIPGLQFPRTKEVMVNGLPVKEEVDQVYEDPWAIPVYVAPDLSLPTVFSTSDQNWIFDELCGKNAGSTQACPKNQKNAESTQACPKNQKKSLVLFNSTRGFRDELIP